MTAIRFLSTLWWNTKSERIAVLKTISVGSSPTPTANLFATNV
jgi:hypothetical protein